MTAQEVPRSTGRPNGRGEELMAELRILRARYRRGKVTRVRYLRGLRREAVSAVDEAAAILARLPKEPQALVDARQAILAGSDAEPDPAAQAAIARSRAAWNPADGDRALADLILDALPPDPDAAQHRADLKAATRRQR